MIPSSWNLGPGQTFSLQGLHSKETIMGLQHPRAGEHDRPILWLAGFVLAIVAVAFLFVTVENKTQIATNYTPIVDEVRIIPPLTQPASPKVPMQSQQSQ
jgi:hypothetical protein